MAQVANEIIKKIKKSKEDPNIDKFEDDKFKFLYVVIIKAAFTISFVSALIFLPENIMQIVGFLMSIFG